MACLTTVSVFRDVAAWDEPDESDRRLDVVLDRWAQELLTRMEQPYVLMVRSTWQTEYLGPFPHAMAAAAAAEDELAGNRVLPPEEHVAVRLIPLVPPIADES